MKSPYIICETACAHDGSVDRLKSLIASAGSSGADAVQLQVWHHSDIVTKDHPDIDLIRRIELSHEEWRACFRYARENYGNMEIIACVGDQAALEFSNDLGADAFKLHTADLGNRSLIETVVATGKRIDLSIGGSTFPEIQQALDWISHRVEVWLMYGYQLFPTPTDGLNLKMLPVLSTMFGCTVGYQDHSPPTKSSADTIPAAALGTGIRVIEKHITDDRARGGADSQAALEPKEFAKFVSLCREVATALGDGHHRSLTQEELQYRKYSKKSLVTRHPLEKGHLIKENDLVPKRAHKLGVPADSVNSIVGKYVKEAVGEDELIDKKHFSDEVDQ